MGCPLGRDASILCSPRGPLHVLVPEASGVLAVVVLTTFRSPVVRADVTGQMSTEEPGGASSTPRAWRAERRLFRSGCQGRRGGCRGKSFALGSKQCHGGWRHLAS